MDINQLSEVIADEIIGMIEEAKGDKAAYNAFIEKKLKKYGVSSPDELEGDEKKKFFDEVDAEWESDAEEKGVEESKIVEESTKDDFSSALAMAEMELNDLQGEMDSHLDQAGQVKMKIDEKDKTVKFIEKLEREIGRIKGIEFSGTNLNSFDLTAEFNDGEQIEKALKKLKVPYKATYERDPKYGDYVQFYF